jgi:MOSC domain-containing protein YiiM
MPAAASSCPTCGFDPAEWNRQDVTRTLGHAEDLIAGWSDGAGGALTDEIAARGRAVTGDISAAEGELDRVHALWHGLVSIADLRYWGGESVPTQRGDVAQLNRSGGGVPKTAVESVIVDRRGVLGDVQATRVHHGRPWQALCLWSTEVIDALVAEGHPISAGAAGENITLSGIDWPSLRAGAVLQIGSVRCQLSAPAEPCSKNRRWFSDRDVSRIDHGVHPGWSRWYASVVGTGSIATGDAVTVEPRRAATTLDDLNLPASTDTP